MFLVNNSIVDADTDIWFEYHPETIDEASVRSLRVGNLGELETEFRGSTVSQGRVFGGEFANVFLSRSSESMNLL